MSVLFFANISGTYAAQPKQNTSGALTGTLQKMIVENGSVTLNLDLNGLNGSNDLTTRPVTLQFAAATTRFFLFSFSTVNCAVPSRDRSHWCRKPTESAASRRAGHISQAARRRETSARSRRSISLCATQGPGLTFFNVEGHQYDYDAKRNR